MKEINSVVTRKGQVTVPVEIRRALGIKEGDRVTFLLEEEQVRLVTRGSIVRRTAGMLRGSGVPVDTESLRERAEEAIAEETAKRMGG